MAKSSCIGVCKLNKKTGLCIGCLRTREEMRDGKRLDKTDRHAAAQRILARMAARPERCV